MDPYVPPEGDARLSSLSKDGLKQKMEKLKQSATSQLAYVPPLELMTVLQQLCWVLSCSGDALHVVLYPLLPLLLLYHQTRSLFYESQRWAPVLLWMDAACAPFFGDFLGL